jgi:asparagine synthetase B (glutamine-hydrolysing)
MTGGRQEQPEAARFPLTQLEIATGVVLGIDPDAPPLPAVPAGLTPLAAFEDAVRSALARPPCVVAFSGGRDSSAVLAVAMRLAREEQLPLPVAVTLRFLDAPGAGEAAWQERVAAHVGLEDWLRIEVGEEADYVGPIAQRLVLRHGVVHPLASVMFQLQLEPARGGSLLTGYGGDSIAGGWLPSHWSEFRAGRARPGPSDLPVLGYALAPLAARKVIMRWRLRSRPVWLRERAVRMLTPIRVSELATRPVSWDRFLSWEVRLRRSRAIEWLVSQLAADADAVAVHPFHDRSFVGALARAGGRRGLGDRSAVMRALFPSELPDDVLTRSTKANFALAYIRSFTRAFARRWDGQSFDPELVDAEALRQTWLDHVVAPRSALALQWAWLDSTERGLEQMPADAV